jgi:hypothetical protein
MKALKIIVLLVLTIALMGCFESIVHLRVNKDGSGTIEETVVISDAFMELMKSFGGEAEGEEEEEEQEPIDEQELTEKAASMGEGVRYVSAEPVKTDRGSGYKAIYSFSDINDVRINQVRLKSGCASTSAAAVPQPWKSSIPRMLLRRWSRRSLRRVRRTWTAIPR